MFNKFCKYLHRKNESLSFEYVDDYENKLQKGVSYD